MRVIDGGFADNTPATAADGALVQPQWLWNGYAALIGFLVRLRRKLPYLVWYGDELDVTVTLSQDKLPEMVLRLGDDPAYMIRPLFSGFFAELERSFRDMGINFDRGMGAAGRDWEWDWSLSGPLHVKFRGRAKYPEKRFERPTPCLVPSPKPAA